MVTAIEQIAGLFERRGPLLYPGEPVTQLEHALQCARLAEEADSPPELIVACLLHDLGHLLAASRMGLPFARAEEAHAFVAACALSDLFPAAVVNPIRLHGEAKRYLSRADPDYEATLSPGGRAALAREGGALSEAGAQSFLRERYSEDAVLLARFDDAARAPQAHTRRFEHYIPLMRACALKEPALSGA